MPAYMYIFANTLPAPHPCCLRPKPMPPPIRMPPPLPVLPPPSPVSPSCTSHLPALDALPPRNPNELAGSPRPPRRPRRPLTTLTLFRPLPVSRKVPGSSPGVLTSAPAAAAFWPTGQLRTLPVIWNTPTACCILVLGMVFNETRHAFCCIGESCEGCECRVRIRVAASWFASPSASF